MYYNINQYFVFTMRVTKPFNKSNIHVLLNTIAAKLMNTKNYY